MKFVAILLLALTLSSCAMLGLDEDFNKAMCQDAKTALAVATVMLDDLNQDDKEALAYWKAYKKGATIAIKSYCGVK